MFSKTATQKSIVTYSEQIEKLKEEIDTADAILIGAGAGLSTAAGMAYDGERFKQYFSDFQNRYGIQDMYSGGFYPYKTLEEYWAWWSRQIMVNRYEAGVGKPYRDLLGLVEGKEYFVLTTNVDHQFQLAGFDKDRLFYTQGDYGLWQCSKPCRQKTYDNEEAVRKMAAEQCDMKIPTELIPKCPVCGRPMTMNLRSDMSFVEDEGWHRAADRYKAFVNLHRKQHILLLELGVGFNTPVIIKYPFWQMTAKNPSAVYICVNDSEAVCSRFIEKRSVCVESGSRKSSQRRRPV